MAIKIGVAALVLIILIVFLQGSLLGGNDPEPIGSVARRGSIPTATPPANLPEPILLGETRSSTGAVPAAGEGTYVVKSGDTLAGIAISLNVPGDQQAAWVAEVLRLNGIADARLLAVGQSLRLPRLTTPTPTPRPAGATTGTATPRPSGTPATATPTRPAGTTATPAAGGALPTATATRAPVSGGGGTYTVVADDNPFVIAAKLGVPEAQQATWVDQLIALNNLNPNAMSVGAVLQLPAGTPSGFVPPAPTATRIP